jgi:DNA repair exonuclease SbcCD ATPase subunit
MSTFDDLIAEIEAYPPVLTAGALIKIAEKLGWQETRRRGSHRILTYAAEGYHHISIKCPGLGREQTCETTRKHLYEIYQPLLDQACQDAKQVAALKAFINQLDQTLIECQEDFRATAYLVLQEIEATANARAAAYEAQRLQECDRQIEQLLTDEQRAYIAQNDQQLTQAQQALNQTQQALQQMHDRLHRVSIDLKQNQQHLHQREQEFQQSQQALHAAETQIQRLEQQINQQAAIVQQQNAELLTLRTNLVQWRQQQRWRKLAEIAALLLAGLLLFTALHPAVSLPHWFKVPQRSEQSQ